VHNEIGTRIRPKIAPEAGRWRLFYWRDNVVGGAQYVLAQTLSPFSQPNKPIAEIAANPYVKEFQRR
jgi:hypothetical protein